MTAAEQPNDKDSDEDARIAAVMDYLDGTLPANKRAEIENKLETDEAWKKTHEELLETREVSQISGLQRARAPEDLTEKVTKEIHARSAGRFFAKRTFGDRVPFGALLVVALIAIVVIAYFMWSSQTGSLKVDKRAPETQQGSQSVVPLP
jgi:anti-sigma factor RsiW